MDGIGIFQGRSCVNSHILVLNYNGQHLLAECLPSIVAAAREVPDCAVSVVDNGSVDSSLDWLHRNWPEIKVFQCSNHGLASYNTVVNKIDTSIVFLLNNDVKLAPGFVQPMLKHFARDSDCFLAAPLCWDFSGCHYEGMRTRVRFRRGLVQASTRFPGYESLIHQEGWTASAGPVLAVDRSKFLQLGGYDLLFHPGRLEDLDLCYRAWLNGWTSHYVPDATAYHKGFGSFEPAFGVAGCELLAQRNTLLFIWKNIRGLNRLANHAAIVPLRLLHSVLSAFWTAGPRRLLFLKALIAALPRLPSALKRRRNGISPETKIDCQLDIKSKRQIKRQLQEGEEDFFERFSWLPAPSLTTESN